MKVDGKFEEMQTKFLRPCSEPPKCPARFADFQEGYAKNSSGVGNVLVKASPGGWARRAEGHG